MCFVRIEVKVEYNYLCVIEQKKWSPSPGSIFLVLYFYCHLPGASMPLLKESYAIIHYHGFDRLV